MAELLAEVAAIAHEAGQLALARWRTDFRRWDKAPGHPVCEVDLAVDAMLRERLAALLPDAGWLSEETADDPVRLERRRVWVVDPIDGTRDYIRGRPGWCVSVALVEDGQPVIGVLDAPALGEVWRAEAGAGATLNGVAVRASGRTELAGARVPADALAKADRDVFVAVSKPNSIALRIAMVAADRADLVATMRWGNEWDIAAAALIAKEAGAVATDALAAPCASTSRARTSSASWLRAGHCMWRRLSGLRSGRGWRRANNCQVACAQLRTFVERGSVQHDASALSAVGRGCGPVSLLQSTEKTGICGCGKHRGARKPEVGCGSSSCDRPERRRSDGDQARSTRSTKLPCRRHRSRHRAWGNARVGG